MLLLVLSLELFASQGAIGDFERQVGSIMERGGARGLAIGVVDSQRIRYLRGFGHSRLDPPQDTTPDTVFPVASVSKIFLGIGAANLIQQGRLSANDTLEPHFTDHPWSHSDPIRLIHLLEHTSGIQEVIAPAYDSVKNGYLPQQDVLSEVFDPISIRWRPGELTTYSNYNYLAVAHFLEKATGKSFDEYLHSTLIAPLGLESTSFRRNRLPDRTVARGYRSNEDEPLPYNDGHYRAAAGLYASAADLCRFLRALLNDGALDGRRITMPSTLDWIEKPTSSAAARAGLTLGHGPGAVRRQTAGRVLIGHVGITDGFAARLFYSRTLNLGYVILSNNHLLPRAPSLTKVEQAILATFFSERKTRQQQPHPSIDLQGSPWTGYYRRINHRFRLLAPLPSLAHTRRVFVADQKLHIGPLLGDAETLVPLSETKFRGSHEVEASVVFRSNSDGKAVMHRPTNHTFERIPWWRAWLPFAAFALWMTVTLIGIPLAIRSIATGEPRPWSLNPDLHWLTSISALGVFVAALATLDHSQQATSLNVATFTMWLMSLVWPATACSSLVMAIWRSYRGPPELGSLVRGVSATGLAIWLGAWGYFGLQLWNYS